MDYLCAKFGDFASFSRLVLSFNRITESQTESQRRMIAILYTHATTVGVSNEPIRYDIDASVLFYFD